MVLVEFHEFSVLYVWREGGEYFLGLYLDQSGALAVEVNEGCMRTSLGMPFCLRFVTQLVST